MLRSDITRDKVHEALSHLYDDDLLVRSDLAAVLPEIQAVAPLVKSAQRMRALLIEAIEVLRPSRRQAFGSLESRSYDVLCLRYIEDMSVARMETELSLSRRQIHRDLLVAETRLTEMLASHAWQGDPASRLSAPSRPNDPLSSELQVLHSQPIEVDLCELVLSAVGVVAPLAQQLRVDVKLGLPTFVRAFASSDLAILRHLLIQVIGLAVQSCPDGVVTINLSTEHARIDLSIVYPCSIATAISAPVLQDARRVALSQGVGCTISERGTDQLAVVLHFLGPGQRSVLVVEDNPGTVELYRRYLDGSGWRVYAASSPPLAVSEISKFQPSVIILDIMMSGLDGWGVLEKLKALPDTAPIPVIICSVVQDFQLGGALGAAAYLKKPVSRGELLSTLNSCITGS